MQQGRACQRGLVLSRQHLFFVDLHLCACLLPLLCPSRASSDFIFFPPASALVLALPRFSSRNLFPASEPGQWRRETRLTTRRHGTSIFAVPPRRAAAAVSRRWVAAAASSLRMSLCSAEAPTREMAMATETETATAASGPS
ncbi:hypothetical protein B0T26DRAFT_229822 [Lasiosphaeria miniovina]|uniref:Uncharacterized protein n=1 Tax=Lasiosphaeria miniovina TaxID=1954250 RepID=A0AA40E3H8_9PEZI|nr:uncharacterized protein B0T26DRAFT_229822 [Lasiosphaeria miniovina]KAK0722721.1 hypothetical protein B0T26DRAFT_229822 [Lasiosphaeria miniovina]